MPFAKAGRTIFSEPWQVVIDLQPRHLARGPDMGRRLHPVRIVEGTGQHLPFLRQIKRFEEEGGYRSRRKNAAPRGPMIGISADCRAAT